MDEDRLAAIARRNRNGVLLSSALGMVGCGAMLVLDAPHGYYVAGLVGSAVSLGYGFKTRIPK